MFEFVIVFFLARHNGRIVAAKGVSPTAYQWGTVGLWFGLEFAGFVVGGIVLGRGSGLLSLYAFGIAGAVAGAIVSTYWANQVADAPYSPVSPNSHWRPTHLAPAAGLQSWSVPDAAQTPTAMVPPGAGLVLSERQGDWARVKAPNGWTGWVDARQLELVPLAERHLS